MTKHPHAIRIAGVDPAKMRDAFGLVIIEILDGVIRVIGAKQWFRTDYLIVEKEIRDIVSKFEIETVFLEVNNTGIHVLELLKKYTVPVYPITTVFKITDPKKIMSGRSMSKSDIVNHALVMLQEDTLQFPKPKSHDMRQLMTQWTTFQESISASGIPQYAGPSNQHDDLVMALLLALHGSRKYIKGALKCQLGPKPFGYV